MGSAHRPQGMAWNYSTPSPVETLADCLQYLPIAADLSTDEGRKLAAERVLAAWRAVGFHLIHDREVIEW